MELLIKTGANGHDTIKICASAELSKKKLTLKFVDKLSQVPSEAHHMLVADAVNRVTLFNPNTISLFLSPSLASFSLQICEWLDWESHHLYSVISNNNTMSLKVALDKIEKALNNGKSNYIIDDKLSVVDIVLCATLISAKASISSMYSATIQKYVSKVTSSTQFINGKNAALAKISTVSTKTVIPTTPLALPDLSLLNTIDIIRAVCTFACCTAVPELRGVSWWSSPMVATNENAKMDHDYQCNDSMSLFKLLKTNNIPVSVNNPRDFAALIVKSFPKVDQLSKVEVAGPGFINIYLSKEWVCKQLLNIIVDNKVRPPFVGPPRRVVIDYSSPNIAKDMHVGHLRSTIIGDTLSRILEFCGHEIDRVNHVGDWGTQFGMLLAYLKDEYPDFSSNPPNIKDLTVFYKAAKKRFDVDEEFKVRAHHEVVALQAGDEINLNLWKIMCKISEGMFSEVYKRLTIDSRLKVKGESFYNDKLDDVVKALDEKGMLSEQEGAKLCFVEGIEAPLIIRKGDGGFGYDTTDMAAIRHRIFDCKATWIIYVVDAGQSLHFKLIFEAAKKAGWTEGVRIEHTEFGVVTGEDGKKFKTRSGDTVRLVDLLDEARDRSKEGLKARQSEGKCLLNDEQVQTAAENLGYGGVKYFDLKNHRINNYQFSYDRMLSPDGDTAVYLQYCHARIAQISKKCNIDDVCALATKGGAIISLGHKSEHALGTHILKFKEVVLMSCEELLPHYICNYLYQLTIKFTDFYRDCRVAGSEEQSSRLLLCEVAAMTIRQCFQLLGITPIYQI